MYQSIFITNQTETEPATVYVWDDKRDLLVLPYSKFNYAYRLDKSGDKISIYGDRVSKTKKFGKNTVGIFESDVPRETRVLTDLYLESDEVAKDHRVLVLDIEVDSSGGYATPENPTKEITAISAYDQYNDLYEVYLLDKENRFQHKPQQVDNERIQAFDNERDLLESFLTFYTNLKPTIITGWNTNGYDIPYLYKRMGMVLGRDSANMLSPIGIVRYSNMREHYQIAGVNSLDYFEMYQKFTFTRRPSYRLDAIGKYEVNMSKIEYEGSLDNLYNEDIHKFIEYNIQDVKIVVALDKKLRFIDLVKNISHIGHTQYEDYKYSSKYIEGTILVYLHRKGIVCSNKPEGGREEFQRRLDEPQEEGFSGAYVKPPKPGLYEWVYNLDLQSLYPSIIMSLNISPETKVGYVRDWNVEAHIKGEMAEYVIEDLTHTSIQFLSRESFSEFMEKAEYTISSNGVLYRTDKKGVIPSILEDWFNKRKEYRAELMRYTQEGNDELATYYDKRQHVQKILLNSIYGVLGLPIFRFYDLDNALAVTATGQDIIKTTAAMANVRYARLRGTEYNKEDECIYIDTDSVYFSSLPFIKNEESALDDTIEIAREMESFLNVGYNAIAKNMFFCTNHKLLIKGESICRTAFWVAKKRYAMHKIYDLEKDVKYDSPKLAVKGLDIVRSSFPPAFGQIMSSVLRSILELHGKAEVDKKISEFRSSMKNMEPMNIMKNTSVQNITSLDSRNNRSYTDFEKGTPAHVKASIIYNRWLRNNKVDKIFEPIRDGNKVKWTYLKKNDVGMDTCALKGYDDPPELLEFISQYIDHQRLFDNELKKKIEDFYEAMSWGKLPTDTNQAVTKFFEF